MWTNKLPHLSRTKKSQKKGRQSSCQGTRKRVVSTLNRTKKRMKRKESYQAITTQRKSERRTIQGAMETCLSIRSKTISVRNQREILGQAQAQTWRTHPSKINWKVSNSEKMMAWPELLSMTKKRSRNHLKPSIKYQWSGTKKGLIRTRA